MTHPRIYPVILAGGSGTRLWPLSRERYPKQLLELTDDNTMLQNTVRRLREFEGIAPSIIVCNENHRFMAAEQMRMMGLTPEAILLEPMGRNTAPAVAIAALRAISRGEDPLLLILPADHFIKDVKAFHDALRPGVDFAEKGSLITFGIVPDAPETGYGYIRKGKPLGETEAQVFAIEKFVEKPDLKTAEQYLASGEYFWNSGMFLFKASTVLAEMEIYAPDMVSACQKALKLGTQDLDFFRLDYESFEACPSDSIDYAIMEKTDKGAMVPLQAGWNDLGSWEALWQVGKKDDQNNVIHGDVLLDDVKNSFLRAESRLVAAVGLENHIVVETADAVLISPRNKVQDVKKIVEKLKASKREESISHKKRYAPWGWSETLVKSDRFEVRRVMIKPGATLALQQHFNRAEHWIVLRGAALVTKGKQEIFLHEDRSTYIPPGVNHRLVNPGKISLEIIEVRSGSYLGEEDIIRMEEVYRS